MPLNSSQPINPKQLRLKADTIEENQMFSLLIKRHQAKIARWRARFGLSEYQVFWMGFGEGLLIGGFLVFLLLKLTP